MGSAIATVPAPALPQQLRLFEVAAACGVHSNTVKGWVRQGHFPEPIRIGRLLLWDAEEVRRFLDVKRAGRATRGA